MKTEQWENLNRRQKWQYFVDYYLKKTIMILAALFIVIFLLWNFLKPQDVTILKVAVVNETLDSQKKQNLQEELLKALGKTGKNEKVVIDDSYGNSESDLSRLSILMNAHEIDAIICNEEDFKQFAGEGYFKDITKVLNADEQKEWSDLFVNTAGYLDKEDAKPDYDGTQKGPVKEYGIDISDSAVYKELCVTSKHPVFAFTVEAGNTQNAEKLLQKLLP